MERKLRDANGSLIIMLPNQLCDLYNMSQEQHRHWTNGQWWIQVEEGL